MYSVLPSFLLGFHGCDESVGEKIFSGKDRLKPSKNPYDWLGNGVYFWENNPQRALNHAKEINNNPKRSAGTIKNPFVIGAVIDLGKCFNLLDSKYLTFLKLGHRFLKNLSNTAGYKMPINRKIDDQGDYLMRPLDCAVIESVHFLIEEMDMPPFDTVRSVYREGAPVYEGTDICEKNHIQICVRNQNCIKGYFRPLNKIENSV